jgi:phospholipase D1/2
MPMNDDRRAAQVRSADTIRRRARVRKALRWLLIVISGSALLTLVIGIGISVHAGAWDDLPRMLDRAAEWSTSPFALLVAMACFVAGGLIVFPVNLLIAATILVFGPVVGAVYALAGSVLSAAVLHQIGRSFPEHAWARLIGTRGEWLRSRVARHGFLAIAVVRLLPLAPYSIVSLAAGAARIPRVPYVAGTTLGMLPGVLMYAFFIDRAREVIADPGPLSWAMLFFALVLIAAATLILRK